LRISWKPVLIGIVLVGLFFAYFELPTPRASGPTDYPSVLADELKIFIKSDPTFENVDLRVLRSWGWRWGRWGARIQIWGIQNQHQQEVLLQHLKNAKPRLGAKRFVSVEFLGGLPDRPPFGHRISQSII
jgi:hypothetical protein